MITKITKLLSITAALAVVTTQKAQAAVAFPCPPGMRCGAGINSVNDLVMLVLGWLLSVAFGLAVLFLIIGGFRYITSAGNEESAEKGKHTIINAVIGIIVIILSYVIVNAVVGTVSGVDSVL